MQHKAKNLKDTSKIAKLFLSRILKKNEKNSKATVIGLSGNLGAGKTTFMQALAKHLGVKNKVNSPTFVIMKKYPLKKQNNFKYLFHLDAYRLKNEQELLYLGWKEIIKNKDHLVFIEWPENVSKAIPLCTNFIYISNEDGGNRYLELR